MRIVTWVALVSAPLMAGCVYYMPSAVSSASIDAKYQAPVQVVTGYSSAKYFLVFGPFGDDSILAAQKNALGKGDGDALVNVTVDRKMMCFPLCGFSLFTTVETVIAGTLVRYIDDTGKRLPPSFQESGQAVGQDTAEAQKMGEFLQSLRKGVVIVVFLSNGESVEGEFKWYSRMNREFLIRPAGKGVLGERMLRLAEVVSVVRREPVAGKP